MFVTRQYFLCQKHNAAVRQTPRAACDDRNQWELQSFGQGSAGMRQFENVVALQALVVVVVVVAVVVVVSVVVVLVVVVVVVVLVVVVVVVDVPVAVVLYSLS